MNYSIAVDIGGTQMRAACYSEESQSPHQIQRIATQGGKTPLERLLELLHTVWPADGPVTGIGLAAPGPVDPYEGVILKAPNIRGWENLPLRQILQDEFHVPAAVGNDANLAALGEWRFGAGQGHHFMIYLTISTGIGGGVILDDHLVLGVRGLATEVGHITVLPDGPLCGCGQRGHLEALASGPAICRWVTQEIANGVPTVLQAGKLLTAKEIGEAARQGDELAIAALARAGTFIGVAVADFLHIFNPTAVIIGGGVTQTGPLLFDPLRTAMREHLMSPDYMENLMLAPAALGDDVGLMGALALARSLVGK